ncbi:MAG TPA: hypothetical protein VK494_08970, partial [Gemmatimonadaceae bacterium]|nr:hypothetical protein [Gemmatimonadaceae bacterium]
MLSSRWPLRPRTTVATAALLAAAACVSLSSPRGGGVNVPVIRGVYKSGANQLVRIALEPTTAGPSIAATGDWGLFELGRNAPLQRFQASQTLSISNSQDC